MNKIKSLIIACCLFSNLSVGQEKPEKLYDVRWSPSNGTANESKPLNPGDSILRSDHLWVTLYGTPIIEFLRQAKVSTQGSSSFASAIGPTILLLSQIESAASPDSNKGLGTMNSKEAFIDFLGIEKFARIALPDTLNSSGSFAPNVQIAKANLQGFATLSPNRAAQALDMFIASPVLAKTVLAGNSVERALAQSTAKLNVHLIVSRDPNRRVDADPLTYLSSADKAKLKEAKKAAAEAIEAIKKRLNEIANFKSEFSKFLTELEKRANEALVKVKDNTDAKALVAAINNLINDAKEIAVRISGAPSFIVYLQSNGAADLQQLDDDYKDVAAKYVAADAAVSAAVKTEAEALINYAKENIPGLSLIRWLQGLLSSLQLQVEEIDRITKTVVISDGETVVPFLNSGDSFGKVALQSEDDITISVEAIDSENKLHPVGKESFVVFKGASYWGTNTSPLGVMYNGTSTVEAGAGQFASYHRGGRGGGSDFKRNFGLSLGVGTAGGDSAGTTFMLGVSLFRDKMFLGYGRNYGNNKDFYFLGIPIQKF